MSFKRWIPLVGALGLMVMVVGAAAGATNGKSKTRTVTRACFWVESKGDRVTLNDVKISRLNKTDVRFCIAGKSGANGKSVRGIAGVVGPAGAQGLQGPAGARGLQGEQGFMGLQGIQGLIGLVGPVGETGPQGIQGEVGPAGPAGAEGPAGPAGATGADGAAGPAGAEGPAGPAGAAGAEGPAGPAGEQGPAGPQGPKGADGLNGSNIVAVDVSDTSGEKTKVALCPLTSDPNDAATDRLFALSGGFSAQGAVTESFRNADGHGWTVTQSSGNTDSLRVFAYCA